MVLRLLFNTFTGLVLGYLLGLVIEFFPRLNYALLDGLHALFGLNSIRTAALLAAIGLIGGIVTGLLHEVLHITTHHYKGHWWKKNEW
ncbi:hypothetical protein [Methanocella sp. MCL-LM]|uniref:hypothetical protein n=1 Tax=Methanocella sp. MCL-LM TaxID=3412035 RepID=UPI003C7703C2